MIVWVLLVVITHGPISHIEARAFATAAACHAAHDRLALPWDDACRPVRVEP